MTEYNDELSEFELRIFKDIEKVVLKAESKFELYHSSHEGYALLLEEVNELWDEVKKQSHDYKKEYIEASHVACVAIRFMKMCKLKDNEIR